MIFVFQNSENSGYEYQVAPDMAMTVRMIMILLYGAGGVPGRGYHGTISTSWRSQNEAAANSIAQAYATQLLIWETVIGERDANFNHVAASGCSNVKDVINAKHPLRNKIFSYYNSMVQSVQNHATIPSFCNKSSGSAKTIELEWNGSKYTTTLTDSNNVLSKYNFKASISGVSFSVNGNKLTVSMDTAPSKEFIITARELKKAHCFKTEKRRGLTRPEQELFMDYLKNSKTAVYWYPVFAVMLGSGLRVGEVTGLRWCDIDLEEGIIDVNHTLVYYDHRTSEGKKGCYFNVNTPKTEAGNRQVPMLDFVREAFVMEKQRQELLGVHCEATVDGYTDFIFLNRFGQPQHQSTLNKAIRRIIRDCNDEQFLKTENPEVLLPHFSCHSLRHTFTTRMCEAGVNIKVIQDTLGHKDITTTLNIYTDVTKELKKTEFEGLDKYFDNSIA